MPLEATWEAGDGETKMMPFAYVVMSVLLFDLIIALFVLKIAGIW